MFVFLAGWAQAQPATLPAQWTIEAGSVAWFQNDNNTRGGAYNPTTGNLIVVSRTGGLNIRILNGDTGAETGTLSTAGITGGTFALSKLAITEDGQIFGLNLQTGASEATPAKVYRWANEQATPEVIFEGAAGGGRIGDGFSVAGTGSDVRLYLGGTLNNNLIRLNYTGSPLAANAFTAIPLGSARGRGGAVEFPNGQLLVNGSGNTLALVDGTTGALITQLAAEMLSTGNDVIDAYMDENDLVHVVTGPNGAPGTAQFFNVVALPNLADFSTAAIVATTPVLGLNANINVSGFVHVDAENRRVFVMASNNAIGAFSLDPPEEPSAVYTASLRQAFEVYVDSPDGIRLAEDGFAEVSVYEGRVELIARVYGQLSGPITMAHIHRGANLTNGGVVVPLMVVPEGDEFVLSAEVDLETGMGLSRGVTPEQFLQDLANGVLYVNVHTSDFPSGEIRGQLYAENTAPPAVTAISPANGATYVIGGDPRAELVVEWEPVVDADAHPVGYIFQLSATPDFSDEGLLSSQNAYGFTQYNLGSNADLMLGVSAFFEARPGDEISLYHRVLTYDGASLTASDPFELVLQVDTIALQPLWTVNASPTSEWFRADNTTRGGAYNPATDNVLVVSRTGGPRIVALDATTGREVGRMNMTGIQGGTFPINLISVTEEGIIYGANLTISPSADPFRVYRWMDQFSEPELIFSGNPLGARYGDGLTVASFITYDEELNSASRVAVAPARNTLAPRGWRDAGALPARPLGKSEIQLNVGILAGGNGNDRILGLVNTMSETVDETSIEAYFIPEAGKPRGRYGLSVSPDLETAWINSPTHELGELDLDTGNLLRSIPNERLSIDFGFVKALETPFDTRWVVVGPELSTERVAIVDVTIPERESILFEMQSTGNNANLNGTGFVDFDNWRGIVFAGSSNNFIRAYSIQVPEDEIESFALPAPVITAPADGASVELSGRFNETLTPTWEMEGIFGRWQIGTDATFVTGILGDTGFEMDMTEVTFTYGRVDSILVSLGVPAGGTATVWHRAISYDGLRMSASAPASVTFTRGTLVSNEGDLALPTRFQVSGNYPNPLNERTALQFDLPEAAEVSVAVYDLTGRRVMTTAPQVFAPGAQQSFTLSGLTLPAGMYVYRMTANLSRGMETVSGRFTVVR